MEEKLANLLSYASEIWLPPQIDITSIMVRDGASSKQLCTFFLAVPIGGRPVGKSL